VLRITSDSKADAIYIQLLDEPIGYTEELDDNRLIDRTLNPGKVVGVDLSSVSKGVILKGLPEAEVVERILIGLGIKVY